MKKALKELSDRTLRLKYETRKRNLSQLEPAYFKEKQVVLDLETELVRRGKLFAIEAVSEAVAKAGLADVQMVWADDLVATKQGTTRAEMGIAKADKPRAGFDLTAAWKKTV